MNRKLERENEVPVPTAGVCVYETDSYAAIITTITEESGNELVVYGIFNTETDVREAELRGLPHAMQWCEQLQEQLDGQRKAEATTDAIAEAVADLEPAEAVEVEEVDVDANIADLDGLAFGAEETVESTETV